MNARLALFAIENGVAQITLNRPARRNALSRELIAQLTGAVGAVAADASARLLLLSANGPAFCAGMDLDEMQERAQSPNPQAGWDADARDYHDLLVALLRLDIPTLAIVGGAAIAGGFGLVLACDLVLASTAAKFSLPEPARGISPAIVAPLLIHRIGAGAASPLLLAGQTLTGEEAFRLRLCHYLAPPDNMDAMRREIEASVLAGAQQALATTKQHLRSLSESALLEQLDSGRTVSAKARQSVEAREGLAAFLEKRRPKWSP